MNYSFIAPSYDGSDPDYRQQARFLQPSHLPTNGPGSENARVAPQPTHPKNKCYHRNHNQNTNSNHQGSSGQTLGSGKKKWRRRGNRNLRDSWDCSPSHPDGAFGRGRDLRLRPHANDLHFRSSSHQGSNLNFAKVRPSFRSQYHQGSQTQQVNQFLDEILEAGQGRRSRGRQGQRNQQHRQQTHFDDQVASGHYGRSGRGPPELGGPHWQPGSCTYELNDSHHFGPFGPHSPTPPEYSFVYRHLDFDGDTEMPEAPQLPPDPWRWYNLQRLIT